MVWKNRPPPRTNQLRPLDATRIQRRTDRGRDEGKAGTGEGEHRGYREGVPAPQGR